jgi:hypothetical protein
MLKSPPAIEANSSAYATTGGTTARVAMPTKQDGTRARYVLVTCHLNACWIDFGDVTVDAVATDSILVGGDHPYIFNVAGKTHFAHLQQTGAALLTVSPLENQ